MAQYQISFIPWGLLKSTHGPGTIIDRTWTCGTKCFDWWCSVSITEIGYVPAAGTLAFKKKELKTIFQTNNNMLVVKKILRLDHALKSKHKLYLRYNIMNKILMLRNRAMEHGCIEIATLISWRHGMIAKKGCNITSKCASTDRLSKATRCELM